MSDEQSCLGCLILIVLVAILGILAGWWTL